jgi:hypothetical protein
LFFHVKSEWASKKLTPWTERKIIQIVKDWKIIKCGIDAGSGTLGVSVLDHLRETEIKHKVIPLNNREVTLEERRGKEIRQKLLGEDMHLNLLSMMQKKEIKLLNITEVRQSLESFQFEYTDTPGKSPRIRIFTTRESHSDSDIIEGLKRAAWMAKKEISLNLFAF